MKVRIVCYEDVNKWILGKFAVKLNEELQKFGVEVEIAKTADRKADINHHIIYYDYNSVCSGIDTLMVTHIDSITKRNLLSKQLKVARMGICMSRETMNKLTSLDIPRKKLCFINPAHDGVIQPKKYIIGIASKVHDDGRKREYYIAKLANEISPFLFSFSIMGIGWEKYVRILEKKGFQVNYCNNFEYDRYVAFIPTLDFYLYTGQDEGQMGFIDAAHAGIDTIVTTQGFHLDAKDGITYGFNTLEELIAIFKAITDKKEKQINSVKEWNWRNYALKHLHIWDYLISQELNKVYILPTLKFNDGIYSVKDYDQSIIGENGSSKVILMKELIAGSLRTFYSDTIRIKLIGKIRKLCKKISGY